MSIIYELIQQNPKYFAWVFGVINALWAGFIFFNKKRHDRAFLKGHSLKVIA